MTTTRFRSTLDSGPVYCAGLNHNDSGKSGLCPSCGAEIVKLDNGRIHNLHTRIMPSGFSRTDYACWTHTHKCEPERQAGWAAATKISLDRGELIHDQHVTVTRGRKFPIGTTGTIFWLGMSDYGPKLGVKLDDSDDKIFIAAMNVTATNQIPVETAEQAAAADPDNADEYLSGSDHKPAARRGSHANCDHEATPAARAKCRKARNA